MKDIKTRTLQDILRIEQIRLPSVKNPNHRKIVMERIRSLATELLYRWRNDPKWL